MEQSSIKGTTKTKIGLGSLAKTSIIELVSAYAHKPELVIWQTDNQAKDAWCYIGTVDDYKNTIVATSQYKDELAYGAQVIYNGDLLKHSDAIKILYGDVTDTKGYEKLITGDDLPF